MPIEAPARFFPVSARVHGGEHLIYAALRKAQRRGAHARRFSRGDELGLERRLLDEAADCAEVLAAPGVPGKGISPAVGHDIRRSS